MTDWQLGRIGCDGGGVRDVGKVVSDGDTESVDLIGSEHDNSFFQRAGGYLSAPPKYLANRVGGPKVAYGEGRE